MIGNRPHQRIGSISNAHAGREFELAALKFFQEVEGIPLKRSFKIPIGASTARKLHEFDLGSEQSKIVVECKSHTWTVSGGVPSAKMITWNQAMYYFHLLPAGYRRIMFVLKDLRAGNGESLAAYYLRTHGHLVPDGVEFWEYDTLTCSAIRVH